MRALPGRSGASVRRLLALAALTAAAAASGNQLVDPGRVLAGGYVHVQWRSDFRAGVYPRHSFGLRRIRVRFQYVPSDVGACIELGCDELDPAVKDAYVQYRVGPWLQFFAGLRKMPFSREELTPASRLLVIERGRTNELFGESRYLGRDIGLVCEGSLFGPRFPVTYSAGVFNGAGARVAWDDNNAKQFAGRLTAVPADWLTLGVSGTQRNDSLTGKVVAAYGCDVECRFGNGRVEGEVLVGNPEPDSRMLGAHVAGACRLGAFEPVLRLERVYPDLSGPADAETEVTIGCGWHLHRRAQVKASIVTDPADLCPAAVVQAQVTF
ncbi:hypothetical protein FJY71_00590 [candidate division WOR-3 bacterium]|nr:hypothetical protein [candidate division WOR-3 bacterium]